MYDDLDADVVRNYSEFSLASVIFYGMKEGACSEQSSRMTAMDNASKNAGQLSSADSNSPWQILGLLVAILCDQKISIRPYATQLIMMCILVNQQFCWTSSLDLLSNGTWFIWLEMWYSILSALMADIFSYLFVSFQVK